MSSRQSPTDSSKRVSEDAAPATADADADADVHLGLDVLNLQSKGKKIVLLGIFCLALFLDTFNNSSLFTAIPVISLQLNIPNSQSVWLLSAYQLTFAGLLLIVRFTHTLGVVFLT
jgi:hypothetical protein